MAVDWWLVASGSWLVAGGWGVGDGGWSRVADGWWLVACGFWLVTFLLFHIPQILLAWVARNINQFYAT